MALSLRALRRFKPQRLRAHIAALMRWHKCAELHTGAGQPHLYQPSASRLGRFFTSVSAGGATAAQGGFAGLSWWRDYIGVPLPSGDPNLQDFHLT